MRRLYRIRTHSIMSESRCRIYVICDVESYTPYVINQLNSVIRSSQIQLLPYNPLSMRVYRKDGTIVQATQFLLDNYQTELQVLPLGIYTDCLPLSVVDPMRDKHVASPRILTPDAIISVLLAWLTTVPKKVDSSYIFHSKNVQMIRQVSDQFLIPLSTVSSVSLMDFQAPFINKLGTTLRLIERVEAEEERRNGYPAFGTLAWVSLEHRIKAASIVAEMDCQTARYFDDSLCVTVDFNEPHVADMLHDYSRLVCGDDRNDLLSAHNQQIPTDMIDLIMGYSNNSKIRDTVLKRKLVNRD
jgi:hypothetical protein